MRKRLVFILGCVLVTTSLFAQAEERKKVVIRPAQNGYRMPMVWKDGEGYEVIVSDFAGKRTFLGVSTLELSAELRDHFGVAKDSGVMVSTVSADSPAAKAGLKAGDIITALDGKKVESPGSLSRAVRDKKQGDQVRVDFRRNGTNQHAFVTLAEREGIEIPAFTFNSDSIREPIAIAGEAVKEIETYFSSPEWKAKVESLQDCTRVQSRVKDLEKRLADLEKRLNQK
jgi:C-terminal processing protease CtpA/Prc